MPAFRLADATNQGGAAAANLQLQIILSFCIRTII
jgi:hypothetical protein